MLEVEVSLALLEQLVSPEELVPQDHVVLLEVLDSQVHKEQLDSLDLLAWAALLAYLVQLASLEVLD